MWMILWLMIAILVIAVIGFIAVALGEGKSKVGNYIFDICMKVCIILTVEVLVLLVIKIVSL